MIVSDEMFYVAERHTDDKGVWVDFGFACGQCACTMRGFLLCLEDGDVSFREEDLKRGMDLLTAVMPRGEKPEHLIWNWSDAFPENLGTEDLGDMLIKALRLDPWEQGRWSLMHDAKIADLIRLSGVPEGWQHNVVQAYWTEHDKVLRENKERLTDAVMLVGSGHKERHGRKAVYKEVYREFIPDSDTPDGFGE